MARTVVTAEPAGVAPDGTEVRRWTLANPERGITVAVLEWGATIQSVRLPDRRGHVAEVALGLPRLEDYLAPRYLERSPFFGATIGRYANRIAGGAFTLDGVEHQVPATEGRHALHGGREGFDRRRWEGTALPDGVSMFRVSPDGEEGFPGTLEVVVEFRLSGGALEIEYRATTDARTIVTLTNHTYWNLGGDGTGLATAHLLRVDADSYLPVDETLIPLGTLEPVRDSPFDFRRSSPVAEHLEAEHLQLERAGGIDHTLVLRPPAGPGELRDAVWLSDPVSGRTLAISTTEPGVQVYTGNFLDGSFAGHAGVPYGPRTGLAFETQHFPDSPHRSAFPSTVLAPGATLRSRTRYSFGVVG